MTRSAAVQKSVTVVQPNGFLGVDMRDRTNQQSGSNDGVRAPAAPFRACALAGPGWALSDAIESACRARQARMGRGGSRADEVGPCREAWTRSLLAATGTSSLPCPCKAETKHLLQDGRNKGVDQGKEEASHALVAHGGSQHSIQVSSSLSLGVPCRSVVVAYSAEGSSIQRQSCSPGIPCHADIVKGFHCHVTGTGWSQPFPDDVIQHEQLRSGPWTQ